MRIGFVQLIAIGVLWLAAMPMCGSEPGPAFNLRDIEYTIALNSQEYLEGQDVIVTSTIKNVSSKPVETLEPWAMAWTVTFDVQKEQDGRRVSVLTPTLVPNGQGHWSRRIVLKPGETRTQSCEISYQLSGELRPGEYIVQAKYHPIAPGEEGYFTQVVGAHDVPFKVVPVQGNELAWPELRDQLVGMVDGDEATRRQAEKLLRGFISDHPRSVFLPQAYDALSEVKWREADYAGYAGVLADWRKIKISDDMRQHLVAGECGALIELGKYEDAIALSKTGTSNECECLPNYVEARKQMGTATE